MAISDLVSKIILEDQFSKAFDNYEKKLTDVDAKTGNFKNSLGGLAVGFGVVAGGLAAGAAALDAVTDSAVENQKAMFNVGTAAAAANSEFGDSLGTIESWTSGVKTASDQFRVFSDQDVANATARLIDMTKRLGFSADQMETLRARTADLSTGKTDLVGGIERVTAAMRGEAESAEFLGLSLNENTVKAYAEAHGLVWKELSDGEKAQERYLLFLEQTDALQGRAAESVKTLAGQEAELARVREREIAQVGGQLLPLRQGEVAAWQLLAETTQGSGSIITNVMAAVTATLIALGATGTTIINAQIADLAAWGAAFQAVWQAVTEGKNPMEAIGNLSATLVKSTQEQFNAVGTFSSTWSAAFDQVSASYNQAAAAQTDFNLGTQTGIAAQSEFATAGQAAASAIAAAYTDLAADQEKLQASTNQKIEAAEFDHGQRIIRINEDIGRATAQAAADAADARIASNAKLTEGLADIDRNLQTDSLAAQADFNSKIAGLDQDRADAKSKTADDIRLIEENLQQDLADLQRDTDQEFAQINSDLADTLADNAADSEAKKLQIIQDGGEKAVAIDQDFADQRTAINDDFSDKFADADPFERQILEFNQQEALSQLDQQLAEEQAANDAATAAAIQAETDRVNGVADILDREAQQDRDRAAQEEADQAASLQRQADAQKAALEASLAEQLKANDQQRAALTANLATEQAQRDQAAADARTALETKNAEELAAIDQQEADKVAKAQEALDRENENYADKLAQLQFSNQQELDELTDKLLKVEAEEQESFVRRLAAAQSFADQQRAILNSPGAGFGFGANPGTLGFAGGGVVPGPAGQATPIIAHGGETVLPQGVQPNQTVNNVTVNNYGASGGYAGASQTGRTVLDALRGR